MPMSDSFIESRFFATLQHYKIRFIRITQHFLYATIAIYKKKFSSMETY